MKTQSELFRQDLEQLLAQYPTIRLTIAQTIQINEVPESVPVKEAKD